MDRPLSTLAVVALLVCSLVAGTGGAAASTVASIGTTSSSASTPPGFVGVAPDNVRDKIPEHAREKIPDHAAWRGAIASSRHAGSLSVDVTTRDALRGKAQACQSPVNKPPFCANPTLALVLTDETIHAGRTIALDREVVVEALGYIPEQARIEHSSGDVYTVPVEDGGETITFAVHEFSTNTVTFTGGVSITGSPSTDGSSYQYDIGDVSSVSNFSIELTGKTGTETDTTSNGPATSHSTTETVSGSLTPTNETLTITGVIAEDTDATSGYHYSNTQGEVVDSWPTSLDSVEKIQYDTLKTLSGTTSEATFRVKDDTGVIGSCTVSFSGTTRRTKTCSLSSPVSITGTGYIQLVNSDGTAMYYAGSDMTGHSWAWAPAPSTVSATVAGTSYSFTNVGTGTATKSVDLALGSNAIDISTDQGQASWSLSYMEHQGTEDVTIEVNGNTTTYAGELANGTSTSLTTDTNWIVAGTNTVNVSVGSGVSGDAPTPVVGLAYRHEAAADQSVAFVGETWSERYNITRTWGSATEDATVSIPFDGNVVAIRETTIYVNGTQTPASWASFDGDVYTLGLGNLPENAETRVVTVGSKVQVHNGSIDVVEPTIEGNALDSKIRLENWGANAYIDLSGTAASDRIHHAVDPSWQNPEDYVVVGSGSQKLHLPNGIVGGTTRVQALPLQITPESGTAEVEVLDPTEPRFGIASASSPLTVSYFDVLDGDQYRLWDLTNEREVVSDEADGGHVTFATGASDRTYRIEEDESSSSGPVVSIGGDGSGGDADPLSLAVLLGGIALSMIGFVFAGRRWFGMRTLRSNSLLLVGGSVVGFVGVEAVTERSILSDLVFNFGAIGSGFASGGAGTVIAGLAILLTIYAIHSRVFTLSPWILILSVGAVAIWMLDAITNGALGSGLGEVSALVWLMVIGGAIALLWRVFQPTIVQVRGK